MGNPILCINRTWHGNETGFVRKETGSVRPLIVEHSICSSAEGNDSIRSYTVDALSFSKQNAMPRLETFLQRCQEGRKFLIADT